MGGSVLAVGGGAPLSHRGDYGRTESDGIGQTLVYLRRQPGSVTRSRPGPARSRIGHGFERTEAHGSAAHGVRLVALGHREARGSATLRPRFVTPRHASATRRRATPRQDAARTRQDAPESTRTGRGYARSTGRQDAAGARLRARGRSVQELHTFLRSVRTRKGPGHPSMPGLCLSRLGSDYRRRMRTRSVAR